MWGNPQLLRKEKSHCVSHRETLELTENPAPEPALRTWFPLRQEEQKEAEASVEPHTPTPFFPPSGHQPSIASCWLIAARCVCLWGGVAFKPGGPQGRSSVAFAGSSWSSPLSLLPHTERVSWFVSHGPRGVPRHLRHSKGGSWGQHLLFTALWGVRSWAGHWERLITLAKLRWINSHNW